MTTRAPRHHGDAVGHVGQAVLRPPVLGEENVKGDTVRPESCEPEGRASSDHAHPSWAESLNMLLDDQDGISLFRDFLSQEGCADIIDFWLACSGFQLAFCAPLSWSSTSMDLMNKRRLKLAKAIYRKYIISGGTVAKKIKPVTKSFINERVCGSQLDSALFQQAKQEVQEVMEVEVYPVFLKSHIFLKYTQEICNEWENHQWDLNSHKQETGNDKTEPINSKQEANSEQDANGLTPETGADKQEVNSKVQEPKSGKKEVQRFLPEIVEKREWAESEIVPANHKTSEHWESGYTLKPRMILGGVKAGAHKSSLLHKPHIHCIPKDVHAEPHKFAADLISRLELVQRERENWRRVKEHLHPKENDDDEVSTASSLCPAHLVPAHHGSPHSKVQLCDTHTENPEIILDQHGQCGQHGQCVTRTPSLSSPTTHTHTCPTDTWLYGDMTGTNQTEVLSYSSSRKCVCKSVTVAYYFCGEPIPYRTTVKGGVVTLAHFRELLTKKGAYR
ncbi:axin-1-like isoform X2 [Tachysurus fulvidraco]|uniref:axin-1-like isoform X2 n=1 Tax=Tachysurus fulvidraco TaxID=1234273 RepID=UPI001FF04169|nr:axin-1-like isoform X2 [Tachysurus fulvidraco]